MARVRCVMMRRDEHLLLDAWFRYYVYLFRFGNLEVPDNGSTHANVIETLKIYERAGSRVFWQTRSSGKVTSAPTPQKTSRYN